MKYLSKIAFAIILSLTFFACSDESSENEIIEQRVTSEQLKFVGIDHNQRLSETYNFLQQNKKLMSKSSNIEKKEMLKNFLISKIDPTSKYTKLSNQLGVNYTQSVFNNLPNSNYRKSSLNESEYELSEKEMFYLGELQNVLDTSTTLDEVNESIDTLNLEIENDLDLNNNNLILLFSATQTAKYSCNYWAYEIDNWNSLYPDESGRFTQKCGQEGCYTDTVGTIGAADVAGAIGGAAGAWAVNVIPGAGQVAYGSAIIGAAVAGSVGAAVMEFFSWWNS